MNLELISPLTLVSVPDILECELEPPEYQGASLIPPTATSSEFNRRGTYVATGYADGRVLVWDFYTRHGAEGMAGTGAQPALAIDAHAGPVSEVTWARRSRHVLTCGADGAVRLWDLDGCAPGAAPPCAAEHIFGAKSPGASRCASRCAGAEGASHGTIARGATPVLAARLRPRGLLGAEVAAALLASGEVWLVQLRGGGAAPRRLLLPADAAAGAAAMAGAGAGAGTCTGAGVPGGGARQRGSPVPSASVDDDGDDDDARGGAGEDGGAACGGGANSPPCVAVAPTLFATALCFDGDGSRLLVGTSGGHVVAVSLGESPCDDPFTAQGPAGVATAGAPTGADGAGAAAGRAGARSRWWVVARLPGAQPASVRHLRLGPGGRSLLANGSDKALRLFSVAAFPPEPSARAALGDAASQAVAARPVREFVDRVEGRGFAGCCFSHDGEWVVGGTLERGCFTLVIWDAGSGGLVRKVGADARPRRALSALAWHPRLPVCLAATARGPVQVWAPRVNWAAFAPEFEEIDENEEYVEAEDEFDTVVVTAVGEAVGAAVGAAAGAALGGDGNNGNGARPALRTAAEGAGRSGVEKEVVKGAVTVWTSDEVVDVVSLKRPAAFESDSEDEGAGAFVAKARVGSLFAAPPVERGALPAEQANSNSKRSKPPPRL